MKPCFCPTRKLPALCVVFVLTVLLASCSAPGAVSPGPGLPSAPAPTSAVPASANSTLSPNAASAAGIERAMKLRGMSLGDKTTCSVYSWTTNWAGEDAICTENITFEMDWGSDELNVPDGAKRINEGGNEYYAYEDLNKIYPVRSLYWVRNGIYYKLSAEMDRSKTALLDIITPQTAEMLVNDPDSDISGFRHGYNRWFAMYVTRASGSDSPTLLSLSLYSPDLAGEMKRAYGTLKQMNNGGSLYYASFKYTDKQSTGYILWNTDIGAFTISMIASADLQKKSLEFANGSLIASINTQLGATITPFPEPTAPN